MATTVEGTEITVGLSSCGIAAGAGDVMKALEREVEKRGLEVRLRRTGCVGMCYREPVVDVEVPGAGKVTYGDVKPEWVGKILDQHVVGGEPVDEWVVREPEKTLPDDSYYDAQVRLVLANAGTIDPESVDEYISRGGYDGLRKALGSMSPDDVIEEIKSSGLRGRGGAGFPTGVKWELAKKQEATPKYMIVNADEGDPGAFMDRSILEGDPHAVLEGLVIGAYAVGASEGYFYVRAEYPLAVRRLKIAIADAKERGFLGEDILGSDFSFDVHIKEGAGAFVCGEETALIASIEGKRGMPRLRPPYPAAEGLWGKPTNNNNVETYANVPWIIREGAGAYASHGTETSKGTKVFALAGKIKRGGLVEVPMGTTLREVIFDIGGGVPEDRSFKAVQLGGPSGGCIPAEYIDLEVDYESVTKTGAIMGSGGMVVMDDSTCMVDIARFFLNFTQDESCGKCTFCRVGTKRMLEVLERICGGEGREGDIELLEELGEKIVSSSLCGLGQTAPNPVLTTLKYFRDEYEAHIREKRCPAGVCKALITYEIDPEKCTGCTLCARVCPTGAASGEKKQPHTIDQELCTKCDACRRACKFDAVVVR
ncbi:MAG: NADH-quinone oxidoreductase subunit NuoF [Candidatus Eisenbacteria bacterium]|nr:NADH-quinone oxidoreductase subunit NuoF [Candidatus Eisenbacteria bacterium]